MNEEAVGRAVQEFVQKGGVTREELFITSKVWCADAHPDRVLPALRRTLRCVRWFLFLTLPRLGFRCRDCCV